MGDIAANVRRSPANWTTLLSCGMAPKRGRPSRFKPVPPRNPVPLYPCANCAGEVPRHQALQQAGYCDACEYMTWNDVCRVLVCASVTPTNLHNSGRLHRAEAAGRHLYHRAEVMHEDARRRAKKIGWSHVLGGAA